MAMICVCCALGAVSLISFLANYNKKRTVIGVFNKMIVSLFFIAVAFFGIIEAVNAFNGPVIKYGLCIMFGLVFGLLGDIYLDQKWVYVKDMKQYLNAGFIVFAIGHIFYCVALSRMAGLTFKWMCIGFGLGAVVAVGNLILEKPTKQKFGQFKAIATVYACFVGATPGFALAAFLKTLIVDGTFNVAFLVFDIGAVFFLLSDLILSPMYFGEGKNTPKNFVLNHLTYYIGQYMFALSVVLLLK